jgi:hypothetical protein
MAINSITIGFDDGSTEITEHYELGGNISSY